MRNKTIIIWIVLAKTITAVGTQVDVATNIQWRTSLYKPHTPKNRKVFSIALHFQNVSSMTENYVVEGYRSQYKHVEHSFLKIVEHTTVHD